MTKIDCFWAAKKHLFEKTETRSLARDVTALRYFLPHVWSIQSEPEDIWRRIENSFADIVVGKRYRERLEERFYQEVFIRADSENIYGDWNGRKYTHHPVRAFAEARAIKHFTHINDQDLGELVALKAQLSEPPRHDFEFVVGEIYRKFGFWCIGCKRGRWIGDDPFSELHIAINLIHGPGTERFRTPLDRQLHDAQLCDECLLRAERKHRYSAARREARDRAFKVAERERARVREEAYAFSNDARAQKIAARAREKERQELEREAAYLLVKKLGLLEHSSEKTHEAANPA